MFKSIHFAFNVFNLQSQSADDTLIVVKFVDSAYIPTWNIENDSLTRTLFYANAGDDVVIHAGDSVELSIESIGESAQYNWLNSTCTDGLCSNMMSFWASPDSTTVYTAEATALGDGYRDYDQVKVTVQQQWINSLYPNPASTNLTVDYYTVGATNSKIRITNIWTSSFNDYNINNADDEKVISVSGYSTGNYLVELICDGEVLDSKPLVVL